MAPETRERGRMKILVISLAGIGDTLFATPLIHELRANFPAAQLDALVMWRGSRDVLENNPHLNTVFQNNLLRAGKFTALKYLGSLRKRRYDLSFNVHPQSRIHYRLVSRLIGARTRVSHRYDHFSFLDRLLINRSIEQSYDQHAIDNNLALLGLVGARPLLVRHDYELHLTPADEQWASNFLQAHQLAGRRILGLHAGSGGTKNLALRRWPLEHFENLIQRLARSHPRTAIALFGGPDEAATNEALLARGTPDQVFVARTENLRQAAALLKRCAAFLSVDTALMHVAAAVKTPNQVVIETPTWNKPIEPYNQPFTLVANPALSGRNLDYYRYDGRGIRGSSTELTRMMESVSVEAVHSVLCEKLG